jgi:hypothetical protein
MTDTDQMMRALMRGVDHVRDAERLAVTILADDELGLAMGIRVCDTLYLLDPGEAKGLASAIEAACSEVTRRTGATFARPRSDA